MSTRMRIDSNTGLKKAFWPLRLEDEQDCGAILRKLFSSNPLDNDGYESGIVSFDLDAPAHVDVTIPDLRGARVRTLVAGRLDSGRQEFLWRGRDDRGRHVAAGVYFARMRTDRGFTATRKMTLVR